MHHVLIEYMKSLKNDVNNLMDNTHVRIKVCRVFYHDIIYIHNEERRVEISISKT